MDILPGNVPWIQGANLCIRVVSERGEEIKEGNVEVSVEYQDFVDRNYRYSVSLRALRGNLLAVDPPPSHIPATVKLWIITPEGKTSDILLIKNDKYWDAVAARKENRNFVGEHTFMIGSDKVTRLEYIQ